ncbi:MAG: acyl transferase [Bacteroidota bacterium]|nr:acyl transferase [Bacteroidota bacterium]
MDTAVNSDISLFQERLFQIRGPELFNALALDLFHLHAEKNPVYRGFLKALGVDHRSIDQLQHVPFLPIASFKSHNVLLEGLVPKITFTSSGTTGMNTSEHHVPWPDLYERSFLTSFTREYGDPKEWRILALLPSYLERSGSSLVYMAERLIQLSEDPHNGTYLDRYAELSELLKSSEREGKKTLLLGVTFALLDLAEKHPQELKNTVIMETGGMKGRRKEMVREDVHSRLKDAFSVDRIHSEYGMTELLSQAWSNGEGIYRSPPWMQIRIRDVNDPFTSVPDGRTGGIDVIDLANIASCPFISTQDLGRRSADGSFEVLGRFDHSDVRGCNLMVI